MSSVTCYYTSVICYYTSVMCYYLSVSCYYMNITYSVTCYYISVICCYTCITCFYTNITCNYKHYLQLLVDFVWHLLVICLQQLNCTFERLKHLIGCHLSVLDRHQVTHDVH